MLRRHTMVRTVSREISEAANGRIKAHRDLAKVPETHLTGEILGAIGERISNMKIKDVVWNASPLPPKEEKRHGADFMSVLDVKLPDYEVKKGFLVQAKKAEPGTRFLQREWCRLTRQCEKMLQRTPASFVFAYSQKGIRVFSAGSVLGLESPKSEESSKSRDIFELYHHGVQTFFENHIECFIGDRRLNSPDIQTLDALAEFSVGGILYLKARPSE